MSEKSTSDRKKKIKKELIDWAIFIVVIGVLYTTGLYKPVASTLQRGLLWTGIIKPDISLDESKFLRADYNVPLLSLDGERTSLVEFKEQVIFMNLWATWCPPCIAEMPNIQALYDSIDNENITFVMLSLDEDPATARAFIEKKGYTFPVYFFNGRRPTVYNSSVVPTTYIISPEGAIVSKKRGMANYDSDSFREFLASLAES